MSPAPRTIIQVPRWDDDLRELVASGEARRLRRTAGIGQETMAAALGIAGSTMSLMENGKIHPRPGIGVRWERVLRALAWHEQAWQEAS